MKYWFDTEFIEDGKTINLISIGIVAEDGREFYAQATDTDIHKASDWVKENVLPHLWTSDNPEWEIVDGGFCARDHIGMLIQSFCNPDRYGKPEFWGYYADYDWVVFCQLFGTMMDLPKGFPMYCRDLKQLCDSLGNPDLPMQDSTEHHALADAKWNQSTHKFLCSLTHPAAQS